MLSTVTGPNSYRISGHRNTQSAEIKSTPGQPGEIYSETVAIDDIKRSVIRYKDSRVSVSILKYNTNSKLQVEHVKISGEANARVGSEKGFVTV